MKETAKSCSCEMDNCSCAVPTGIPMDAYCLSFQNVSNDSINFAKLSDIVTEEDFEYPPKLLLYLFNMFAVNYDSIREAYVTQMKNLHFHDGCCQPLCVEIAVSSQKFMNAFNELILGNLGLFGVKESSFDCVKDSFIQRIALEQNDEKRLNEMKQQARIELLRDNCKPSIVKELFRNNLNKLNDIRHQFLIRSWEMTLFCSTALTNVRQTIDKYGSLHQTSSNLSKLEGLFEEFVSDHYINVSQPYVFRDNFMDDSSPRTHWLNDANEEDNPATFTRNQFRSFLRVMDLTDYKQFADNGRKQFIKAINENKNSVSPALQAIYDEITEDQLCRGLEKMKLDNSESAKNTANPTQKCQQLDKREKENDQINRKECLESRELSELFQRQTYDDQRDVFMNLMFNEFRGVIDFIEARIDVIDEVLDYVENLREAGPVDSNSLTAVAHQRMKEQQMDELKKSSEMTSKQHQKSQEHPLK